MTLALDFPFEADLRSDTMVGTATVSACRGHGSPPEKFIRDRRAAVPADNAAYLTAYIQANDETQLVFREGCLKHLPALESISDPGANCCSLGEPEVHVDDGVTSCLECFAACLR